MSPEPGAGSPNRRRALIGGLALLVVVVLVAVWLGTRSGDSSSPSSSGSSSTPTPSSGTNPGSTLSPTPSAPGKGKGSSASASPGAGQTMNPAPAQQVRFAQPARPAKDVTLVVTKVEPIIGKGHIPGEISGPALRISLTARNDTARRIAVNTTVANLYYGADRTPASPLIKSGAKPFPASIRPGQQATGVFVFTVPKNDRAKLQLEVVLGARFRVVNFNGSCPTDC